MNGQDKSAAVEQAARGLGPWVAWSALAYTVFVLVVVSVEGPRVEAQA